MTLAFQKLHPLATLPQRATKGSAGYDLAPLRDQYIGPNETVVVETGLRVDLPEGYVGLVRPRSSLFRKGITVEGVIDADYEGELMIMAHNRGSTGVWFESGQRVAQMVVVPFFASDLVESERTGGFGSTDV